MAMNDFAPYLKMNGCFIVQNVSPQVKTIKIFNYPINYMGTRDILQIPGVSEADIRASLLKGELNHKIRAKDIFIICSDVDLLQFNDTQKQFLLNAGITNGIDIHSLGGITAADHEILKQLIHFVDEGPGDGFISGAYKVIVGQPFPTSIIWYVDNSQTKKIVEKNITYTDNMLPSSITWNMYDANGTAIVHNITDTITYTNNAFESTRTRTIV
jgi:hypothetical protein